MISNESELPEPKPDPSTIATFHPLDVHPQIHPDKKRLRGKKKAKGIKIEEAEKVLRKQLLHLLVNA